MIGDSSEDGGGMGDRWGFIGNIIHNYNTQHTLTSKDRGRGRQEFFVRDRRGIWNRRQVDDRCRGRGCI